MSSRKIQLCKCVNSCVKCNKNTHKHTEQQRGNQTELNPVIWNPSEFNYLVTLRVQQHTSSSSLHRSVSRIMAVPSARWPHAVFPGLLGNKGRKNPFYSITPAAPGHRANTKESGFIKTISARNEPNKLIYHQPSSERGGLQRHKGGWLVFWGAVERSFTWAQLLSKCVWVCVRRFCACVRLSGWIWRNLTATPMQSSRRDATLTAVCSCVFLCLCHCSWNLGEEGRGGNNTACQGIGIWGEGDTHRREGMEEGVKGR